MTNKELLLTDEERERYWFVKTDYENNFGKALEAQLKKATDYYEPLIEKAREEEKLIRTLVDGLGNISSNLGRGGLVGSPIYEAVAVLRRYASKILKDEGQSLKQEPEKGNRDGKAL